MTTAAPVLLLRSTQSGADASSETVDVARGLAALAMVVNHVGVTLPTAADASSGSLAQLVFLGSIAPAIFFFLTGYGSGLQSGKPVLWRSVLVKVSLLLLADQLLVRFTGRQFGLDFFGFIAISTLAVSALRTSAAPDRWAFVLIIGLIALRFGAPRLAQDLSMHSNFLAWVLGVRGVSGISYPLSPWLVAPLAGFLAARHRRKVPSSVPIAMAVCATLVAGLMAMNGTIFFRWGTVSAAYLVIAAAVVLWVWLASRRLRKLPLAMSLLRLPGSSAFMVVPLHYAMLALLGPWHHRLQPSAVLAAMLMIALTVVVGSRGVDRALSSGLRPASGLLWAALALCLVGAFAGAGGGLVSQVASVAGQICAGILLAGLPSGRNSSPANRASLRTQHG